MKKLVSMKALLTNAAAELEAKGWKITWNEEEENFQAVNRLLTCPVLVYSVFNDKLLIEQE